MSPIKVLQEVQGCYQPYSSEGRAAREAIDKCILALQRTGYGEASKKVEPETCTMCGFPAYRHHIC